MNHNRIPKEAVLPEWARRDKQGIKNDCVKRRRAQIFQSLGATSHMLGAMDNMKQATDWRSTNTRRHRTKLSRPILCIPGYVVHDDVKSASRATALRIKQRA
jgi:hypothetical protein